MRECRIDRIRLCKTGSAERNSSALLKTNAGSSLNSTLSSMLEILPESEQRCGLLNRGARNWERVTRHSSIGVRGVRNLGSGRVADHPLVGRPDTKRCAVNKDLSNRRPHLIFARL